MGKRSQHMEEEIYAEPVHFDHLAAPPRARTAKEMNFDSLDDFQRYIKDESGDNEFDQMSVHVKYLPPFIIQQTHGNDEKIKPQMNSLNKKFRRHLQHHVKRHLLPEISRMSGIDYDFKKVNEGFSSNLYGTTSAYKWQFMDESNHGFDESEYGKRNHWKVEVNVETTSNGPYVDVDFKATSLDQPEEE
ncbi:DEKNAAC102602 [Brettanomyces naardenensis]|uniref:Respiratory growth induced protein 1 n=1 Tax=Brettanomyces naardenensis TaxID=13370 RepID=A0A448YKT9_BRENA|nr:DEKNAAC102602 [Brettanomyces naardenensis]